MLKISKEAMRRWKDISDDIKTQLLSNTYCDLMKKEHLLWQ
jgi:hypothetical protein